MNSATTALFEAQAAMAQAGFRMPLVEVDGKCYFRALWDLRPEVRNPRPGTRTILVLFDTWLVGAGVKPTEPTGAREIWVTLDQERQFETHGPGGKFIVRRSTPPEESKG